MHLSLARTRSTGRCRCRPDSRESQRVPTAGGVPSTRPRTPIGRAHASFAQRAVEGGFEVHARIATVRVGRQRWLGNLAQLEEKWRIRVPGGASSTPVIYDGTVYFGSWDGRFYAADAATGALRWQRTLSSMFVRASALVTQDRVYVPAYRGLFALAACVSPQVRSPTPQATGAPAEAAIELPLVLEAGELQRSRLATGLANPRGMHALRDGSRSRARVIPSRPPVGCSSCAITSLAYFGGPTTIFRIAGEQVAPWGSSHGNLNDLTYDLRRKAWVAVASTSDEVVQLVPGGRAERLVKIPPLAHGQDAVPAYLRYDPHTGDLLVTLFSGSPVGEEGGSGVELVRRAGSRLRACEADVRACPRFVFQRSTSASVPSASRSSRRPAP